MRLKPRELECPAQGRTTYKAERDLSPNSWTTDYPWLLLQPHISTTLSLSADTQRGQVTYTRPELNKELCQNSKLDFLPTVSWVLWCLFSVEVWGMGVFRLNKGRYLTEDPGLWVWLTWLSMPWDDLQGSCQRPCLIHVYTPMPNLCSARIRKHIM